jgi:hypothetical protein
MRCTGTLWPAFFLMSLFVSASARSAEKKLPIEQTSNELVSISANVYLDKDQIRQALGTDRDLGPDMLVVRVTLHPVSDKPIRISLDDFLLVSAKDGERSQPFAPSQIAGSTTLVVTPQTSKDSGPRTGVSLGGFGIGRTQTNKAPTSDTKVETTKSDKEDPLLAVLTEKCLPEKETTQEVSGLLYFELSGKLKPKDLELHYKTPSGRLSLRFRP